VRDPRLESIGKTMLQLTYSSRRLIYTLVETRTMSYCSHVRNCFCTRHTHTKPFPIRTTVHEHTHNVRNRRRTVPPPFLHAMVMGKECASDRNRRVCCGMQTTSVCVPNKTNSETHMSTRVVSWSARARSATKRDAQMPFPLRIESLLRTARTFGGGAR
jgi:hypothetical protein